MIEISEDVDVMDVLENTKRDGAGCVAMFLGTVRDTNAGKPVERLELEAHREMAVKEMEKIRDAAIKEMGALELSIVHRVGKLAVGDDIVFIAASAAHREQAFRACRFAIEELKRTVPLWKKEFGPGGECWLEGERWE